MPITPSHEWHESEAWVSIDVKIPNVTTASADIVTTTCYVKVNCAPYFFEADLYGDVDSKSSKASVGLGAIKFFLVKKEQGLWERLSIQGDKYTRLLRRQQSLEAIRDEREKTRKEYGAKFSNIGRLAVGDQMRMDEVKRKIIEKRKEEENFMEQERIESWKKDLPKTSQINDRDRNGSYPHLEKVLDTSTPTRNLTSKEFSRQQISQSQAQTSSLTGNNSAQDLVTWKNTGDSGKENHQNADDDQKAQSDSNIKDEQQFLLNKDFQNYEDSAHKTSTGNGVSLRPTMVLPAPRNCSTVSVTFSPKPDLPRHLPARESRDKEIKLKKSGMASKDTLDVSERAPIFLQDKGDKFFKAGDFQSAINAYTDALEKDSLLVMSFANRGACKLQMKDYGSCVHDCTSALCILTKGTLDLAPETMFAQEKLIQEKLTQDKLTQENISCQDSFVNLEEDCRSMRTGCDVNNHVSAQDVSDRFPVRFSVESLELLTCLSGKGCCSMRGLTVEGAGVEQWKLGMKIHVLIRRGVANYYLGELLKAIDDFSKVIQIQPDNEEVNRVLKDLRTAEEIVNKQS